MSAELVFCGGAGAARVLRRNHSVPRAAVPSHAPPAGSGMASRSRCRVIPAGGSASREDTKGTTQDRPRGASSTPGPTIHAMGKSPALTAETKSANALALKISSGPFGSLLSRTGTIPAHPSAISMQSLVAPLNVLLRQVTDLSVMRDGTLLFIGYIAAISAMVVSDRSGFNADDLRES